DPNVVLLDQARSGDVDAPDVAAAGEQLTTALAGVAGVSQVASYWSLGEAPAMRSLDGTKALIVARIDGGDDEVDARLTSLTAELGGDQGAVTVTIGGRAAVDADLSNQIGGDLAVAESIAVPITLVLLVLVFGGLIAAGLPLVVALISVAGTFLSLFVIGSLTDVSIYSINLTTALGLGLSIDYSLFIVNRFREELARGTSPRDAVVRTVETAGRTVAFSAFTVAASLVALLIFPLYFLRSFAYAGISVVLIAAAGAVVSLPALLAVLGHRVDALGVRRHARHGHGGPLRDGFWQRLAQAVMRRPIPIAAGAIALLLVLGAPFLRVAFALPTAESLPKDSPARRFDDRLATEFAADSSESFAIVVPQLDNATGSAALDAYAQQVSALDDVTQVDTLTGTYRDGASVAPASARNAAYAAGSRGAYLAVTPAVEQRSAAGELLVHRIRALHPPFADGVHALVEGSAAQLIDTKAAIADRLPYALGIIALITFVLLFLVFGSLLVPIKAIVLNLLSLTATFGAMVWIFQDGHGAGWLGFTATGSIDTSMPILMFCIAFGLSMDYEVFLLSRIKEEHDCTGDNTRAVAVGLERTGRIVTAAAALLAVTFLAFATSGVTFIKMFGLGLALAVVMDATIIRGLLVPAFMRLAGDANWWAPAWMRRIHARIGIRDDGPRRPSPGPAVRSVVPDRVEQRRDGFGDGIAETGVQHLVALVVDDRDDVGVRVPGP
ncbi:MAG: Integral rane protein, partial [Ilumatobacteraceae bacterium]|nr:Integral rane protein [Ilumatobacteraceae bacterium]